MRLVAIAALVWLALTAAAEARRRVRVSFAARASSSRAVSSRGSRSGWCWASLPFRPPTFLETVPTGSTPWRYWSKSGLVIKANSPPVDVSVPLRWRTRVSIGWGDRGGSELRIASCPPSSALGDWNPYTGGFYLRSRAACVPLTFRVGDGTATVRFGVGKRCG